jgi:hypothetical chaperone protein
MKSYIGVDFGTTNSVIAISDDQGHITTAKFNHTLDTFRTVLCFWQDNNILQSAAGQDAIDEYLNDTQDSRFIQSIKTYLASTTFTDTRIYNRRYALEDLIALFIKTMWDRMDQKFDLGSVKLVAGRPVNFAGTNPDNVFAENRLRDAYGRAGFKDVSFAYEPTGAAYYYAEQLQQDARILVADFGGGTSDFSIMESVKTPSGMTLTPRAHSGIGIAGDLFDFRIIDNLVAQDLGKGSRFKSFDKWLDVPTGYYRSFAAWHMLSMIKTPKLLREIEEITRTSDAPEKLMRLHTLIEKERGYMLYRAVSRAKAELSSADETQFNFETDGIKISRKLRRKDFDKWIKPDLDQISATIDTAMKTAQLKDIEIDRVFMTGGTSLVPAVQDVMKARFGADKMASGNEFTSVCAGLALMARAQH